MTDEQMREVIAAIRRQARRDALEAAAKACEAIRDDPEWASDEYEDFARMIADRSVKAVRALIEALPCTEGSPLGTPDSAHS